MQLEWRSIVQKSTYYLFLLLGLIPPASASQSRWKNFCERYIVADDPYQYIDLNVDQLVTVYFAFKNTDHYSRSLHSEIKRRLADEKLSRDDREILSKLDFTPLIRKPPEP